MSFGCATKGGARVCCFLKNLNVRIGVGVVEFVFSVVRVGCADVFFESSR